MNPENSARSIGSGGQTVQNDESVMESDEMEDYHQDSAINLSNSSQRICNGIDFPETEKSDISCTAKTAAFGDSPPLKAADLAASNLMPAGLQHLFQQQMTPPQLHQLLQHQQFAEVSRNQLQDSARHVQEQLHLALLQQNQGVSDKNKAGSLSMHPSPLMHQVQMLQRQYLLNQAGIAPNNIPGLVENNNISMWDKPVSEPPLSPPGYLNSRSPALTNGGSARGDARLTNGNGGDVEGAEEEGDQMGRVGALFNNGICNWPGCETPCDKFSSFLKHLSTEHTLDDRSTAHARVQMQVVQQMESNLAKERARLDAMMAHLHMSRSQVADSRQTATAPPGPQKPESAAGIVAPQSAAGMCESVFASSSTPVSSVVTFNPFLRSAIMHGPSLQHSAVPIRRRHADKPIATGPYDDNTTQQRRRVADRSGQDITEELSRNRDFYCNTDIRPPFTYASLIRQAIIESPDRQLTLNEIYSWFQATFAYFRRNAATWKGSEEGFRRVSSSWKNAVRHNLSLHKCFARVENVKGAVWTVDEVEFCKRRSQRTTGPSRSPTLSNSPTTLYGDCLNLSLPSGLGDMKVPFMVGAADRLRDTPTLLPLPRSGCDSPPLSPAQPASEGGSATPAGMYSPGLLAKRDFEPASSPSPAENTGDPEGHDSLEHNAEDLRIPTVKVEYDEGEHPLPTSVPV